LKLGAIGPLFAQIILISMMEGRRQMWPTGASASQSRFPTGACSLWRNHYLYACSASCYRKGV